jgi:hypothetical protein
MLEPNGADRYSKHYRASLLRQPSRDKNGLGRDGKAAEGLSIRWCVAEVLRIKGELIPRVGATRRPRRRPKSIFYTRSIGRAGRARSRISEWFAMTPTVAGAAYGKSWRRAASTRRVVLIAASRAMSDLNPLCAPKRTSAKRTDQGDARAVSGETKRLPLRQ